jgi:hypothetical protein
LTSTAVNRGVSWRLNSNSCRVSVPARWRAATGPTATPAPGGRRWSAGRPPPDGWLRQAGGSPRAGRASQPPRRGPGPPTPQGSTQKPYCSSAPPFAMPLR